MAGVFAVFVGLGLAGPVSAAPPPGRPAALSAALLSESDMPPGYEPRTLARLDEMFTSALAGYRPGADPCTAPPLGAAPASRPLTDQVKAKQSRPPARGPAAARTATALFLHEREGVAAVQMLAAPGERTAAAMIDDAATVLGECPVITTVDGRLTVAPLRWKPSLGDDSITVGLRFEWDDPAAGATLLGKMALVAYRDMSLTVGLIGVREPSERDLKDVVRAAVRKVVLTSGISVKERT